VKIVVLIVISFFANTVFAQTNISEIITDRPDITESAVTVPLHFIQIETGYQYNKEGLKFIDHFGSTLLRYGLTSNIELRFAGEYQKLNFSPGVVLQTPGDDFVISYDKNEGFAGSMVGAKFQLTNSNNNFSVLTQFYLPIGKRGLVPEKVEPEIILAYDTQLTKSLVAGINTGIHWNSTTEKMNLFYSISFGVTLTRFVSWFLEYSGTYANQNNFNNFNKFTHLAEAGITVLVRKNIQLDLYAGTNIITNDLNWFWGTGISLRLPK